MHTLWDWLHIFVIWVYCQIISNFLPIIYRNIKFLRIRFTLTCSIETHPDKCIRKMKMRELFTGYWFSHKLEENYRIHFVYKSQTERKIRASLSVYIHHEIIRMWPFSIHVITFVFAFVELFVLHCTATFGTFPTELQLEYGIRFYLSHYADGIKIFCILVRHTLGNFFFIAFECLRWLLFASILECVSWLYWPRLHHYNLSLHVATTKLLKFKLV